MNSEIIKYLNGQMSELEREDFEQRLDLDESLSDELMRIVAREGFKHDLKEEFEAYETEHTSPGQMILFRRVIKIAALILILVTSSVFITYYLSKPSHLIVAQYMDYPLPGNHRNGSSGESQPLSKAFEAFSNKDFELAAGLFTQMAGDPGLAKESHLYAGISLLWIKKDLQTELALKHFQEVLSTKNDRNDAALWFLAIGQYEVGNKDEARLLFTDIAANHHHFRHEQAAEILENYY
ncbi:MAG: hypothetical protein K9H16_12955 [Bacteroidales bacterium]|nr:hypothetical protein [Bacteroidales bacterium]